MKKVYFLCLLVCMSIMTDAQTDTFYAIGTTGSYITGSAIQNVTSGVYTRSEGIIPVANSTTTRQTGYAVFDISSIPIGSTVSYVELGVNVFGYTYGTGGICTTFARAGSLAGVTNATTLYNNCTGTGGTNISTLSFGTGAPFDWKIDGTAYPNFKTFIVGQVNVAHQYVTMSFCIGGATTCPVYNLKGGVAPSAGSAATAGPHAPYLIVTYCTKPTVNAASIAPTAVCTGSTFSLTGTASNAANYRWRGPGGFVTPLFPCGPGTPLDATGVATTASAGTYTLTVYTNCGAFADSTLSTVTFPGSTVLAVNPSPAALVTTATTLCIGDITNMSDITAGGAWSSSNNLLATVNTTGMVTAVNNGTPIISYKLGACAASATVTINAPPNAIIGGTEVCASGGTLPLSDDITGIPNGTWTSSVPAAATVDPLTGVVTGVVPGVTNISYTNGACPAVVHAVTVNPLPNPIAGANVVCVNATIGLTDASPGGTWSSADGDVSVDPNTGVVTGVDSGAAIISYTLPTGCYITKLITVNFIPEPITGPTGVCENGSTIALSDPTPTGTWSSSSTPRATVVVGTGVVTGVTAGAVTISYILPTTGCFVTHPVTVNPLPNTITGLKVVCTNQTIMLSDAAPGGQWTSGATTIATVDGLTGEVGGVGAGVVWITYTLATGCFTRDTVTVLPLPPAVITPGGPTTFCTGGSVTLNANTGGTLTYQWYSNHTPIIGAMGTSYVSNATEVIEVRVTDGNGCIHMSDTTQVTLIPSVTILANGPVVFCQPGNVTLSVPLAPGILYQWKLNGTNITGANSHTWLAVSDGLYTADLVIPGGCASTTPTFRVTVHPMPVPVIAYNGSTLSTPPGYLTYQWFLNATAMGPASPTATSITPTTNGSYIVRVVDGNGCIGYSTAYIFNLGVESVGGINVSIYPNPANTVVNIDAPMDVRAVITSVDGKTIIDQPNAKKVDISKLSNGLYMIMLYDKNGDRLVTRKLVKE